MKKTLTITYPDLIKLRKLISEKKKSLGARKACFVAVAKLFGADLMFSRIKVA